MLIVVVVAYFEVGLLFIIWLGNQEYYEELTG
jgi:hypothetical protein